jgi:hypothetical protein
LLDSERRSMQLRVADQVEAERRAAMAAGRRRIERQLAAQLAEEHAAALAAQQVRHGARVLVAGAVKAVLASSRALTHVCMGGGRLQPPRLCSAAVLCMRCRAK